MVTYVDPDVKLCVKLSVSAPRPSRRAEPASVVGRRGKERGQSARPTLLDG